LGSSLKSTSPALQAISGKRPRRSWSAEEKRLIVDEAVLPGASVADIARRHGVNANLVFTWRKRELAASSVAPEASAVTVGPRPDGASPSVTGRCEFIPIGVFAEAADGKAALATELVPAAAGGASSRRAALPRPGMDERPGVIEIDLADGTRLRVDAFVNERALRRVLAVLKVTS
jgi:transposase